MFRVLVQFFRWLLLVAVVVPVAAETVRDLHTAEVVAADRGQQALDRAARDALEQVLVKVAGSTTVLRNPQLAPALGKASNYVQRYTYLGEQPGEEGVGVRFQFEGSSVTELVTSAGAPVWTANRPVVLTWLAARGAREPGEADGGRLVSADTDPALTDALFAAFSRRGVPARLPAAGAPAVSLDQLWRPSLPAVEQASRPYGLEDVLVGRLSYDEEGRASGQWTYLQDDEKRERSVPAGTEREFMDAGVGLVADAMAARYAVAPTEVEDDAILITVAGIRRYADYASVVNWFEALELVEQANLVHIAADQIELRLVAQIDAAQLEGLIRMNERLVQQPGEYGERLSYQWQN